MTTLELDGRGGSRYRVPPPRTRSGAKSGGESAPLSESPRIREHPPSGNDGAKWGPSTALSFQERAISAYCVLVRSTPYTPYSVLSTPYRDAAYRIAFQHTPLTKWSMISHFVAP